jgi:hypothetical protein
MGLIVSSDYAEEVASRTVEGGRLVRLCPNSLEQQSQKLFMKYMKIFLEFDKFLPRHTPFLERKFGPAWFTEDFPAMDPDNDEEVNEIWKAYLDPTVISCRIGVNSNCIGLVGCQPNLVSRQFGLTQIRPKSLFENASRIVMGSGLTEKLFKRYLRVAEAHAYSISPFKFNNSCFCTTEFSIWWERHYIKWSVGDAAQVLRRIGSGFVIPQIANKPALQSRGNFILNTSCLCIVFLYLIYIEMLYIGKAITQDTGSSRMTIQVKKPVGVVIKSQDEAVEKKVFIFTLRVFYFV